MKKVNESKLKCYENELCNQSQLEVWAQYELLYEFTEHWMKVLYKREVLPRVPSNLFTERNSLVISEHRSGVLQAIFRLINPDTERPQHII